MLTRGNSSKAARATGFTLIELMVTVMIVAVLASIAVPSYLSSVRKSRRTEARQALLDLAGREERYLATSTTYSQAGTDLGYSALPATTASGYYTIDIDAASFTAPSATATAYFKAVATPVAGKGQDKDSTCASLSVDSQGVQKSTDSSGADSTATCWQQ